MCLSSCCDVHYSSSLQVLVCEIVKHQRDVVMLLSIIDTNMYNNFILLPFICAG